MKNPYPKRQPLRLINYDYSQCGAYFVTLCANERKPIFWYTSKCRGELCSPVNHDQLPLSSVGRLVRAEIDNLQTIYPNVKIDTYCIMPDHIHLLLTITGDAYRRTQFAPTLSRIIKQFKGVVTKKLGYSVWQKSFMDRVVRSERDYQEIWRYIDNNPRK